MSDSDELEDETLSEDHSDSVVNEADLESTSESSDNEGDVDSPAKPNEQTTSDEEVDFEPPETGDIEAFVRDYSPISASEYTVHEVGESEEHSSLSAFDTFLTTIGKFGSFLGNLLKNPFAWLGSFGLIAVIVIIFLVIK